MRNILGGLGAMLMLCAPAGAQQPAGADWDLAAATFAAHRADGKKPPTGKRGAKCAGYWTAHLGALTRQQWPPEALAAFDSELASGDEASLNAMVFSQLTTDSAAYAKGKDEAAALVARLLAGDRASLTGYFRQLGECSMGGG